MILTIILAFAPPRWLQAALQMSFYDITITILYHHLDDSYYCII